MKPLKLIPLCKGLPFDKNYIWGGTRLIKDFNKGDNKFDTIAESWELSCYKDGLSVIAEGEYKGKTLLDYLEANDQPPTPIIIKLIDAEDDLSVQVHPSDEQVKGEGKTEMWYIVDAKPDAKIIYGFKNEISREEFRERIKNNKLLEVVNYKEVKAGDVFFIPAGTLHAIGKGILIAEIQQSSNTTYRVYDYNRKGADGKPRQLHIEEAIKVTDLTPPQKPYNKTSCEYFNVNITDVNGEVKLTADDSFNAILTLSGDIDVNGVKLTKGETCFIPKGCGDYIVKGSAKIIITKV